MTGGTTVKESSQRLHQASHNPSSQQQSEQSQGETSTAMESVWVFGYGSLLWKTNFPYESKVVGYVEGYARRFWQGNTDHRGIPGAPGRVVTLIQSEEDTWGIAYKVNPEDVPEVIAYLDHREQGGYTTHKVLFHPKPETSLKPFTTLVYIGTEANSEYLGPASVDAIARQVVSSKGSSGPNIDYAINLAEAMRSIAPSVNDEHLFSLERKINELIKTDRSVKTEERERVVKIKVTSEVVSECMGSNAVAKDNCNFCSSTATKRTMHNST